MAKRINKHNTIPEDARYLQDTIHVIGGKWKLHIILSLANGNSRFTEILRSIPKITSRKLSAELKALEVNKLVTRKADDDSVAVEYEITDYCSSFDGVVKAMIDWGKWHRKYIAEHPEG